MLTIDKEVITCKSVFLTVMAFLALSVFPGTLSAKDPYSTAPGKKAYNFTLTNQDSVQVRLSDFQDKAVLMSYVFTRCPMPTMCPLISTKMAQVHGALNPQVREEVALITISFDPDHDTPDVLKAYGKRYTDTFRNWQFLTGDKAEIEKSAQQVGLEYQDMGNGLFSHNLQTILIKPGGYIVETFRGADWDPKEVAKSVEKAAR